MTRPTKSRPQTGSGLSRPTPSRVVPRSEAPPSSGAPQPHRGGAAAAPPATSPAPTPADATLPAATAAELGIPPRDENIFAGRYRIEKKLGRGGMGSVFLATQLVVDRKVAIKVLENVSEDGVMVARFQREARVIAQLQHPNIVNLIDFGENERGQLYLVMEYIDGEALKDLIKREAPLDPQRVVRIALQITEALAAAHDINVIHRDLKPDNIMLLGGRGRSDYVKILDFGIAKVKRTDPGQDTVQTRAGLIVGSLRYISPEQVESKEITVRTDFYALGGILYEMLGGKLVFDYASPADCAIAHLTEPPKPPTYGGVPFTGPLVDLIMQCLEKDPARRPPSAHVVIAMLRACEHAPVHQNLAHASDGEIPTEEQQDVHHSATVDLGQIGPEISQPAVPQAPSSRPTSRPISRPTSTVTATSLGDVAMPQRRSPSGRSMTDCNIDLRRPEQSEPRGVADASLWSAPGTGDAPAHTVTQHAPLAAPQPSAPRRGAHPVLWVMALLGLAAVGALIVILATGGLGGGEPPSDPAPSPAASSGALPPAPAAGPGHPVAAAETEADVVASEDVTAAADTAAAPEAKADTVEPTAEADTAAPAPTAAPVASNAVRIESDPADGVEIFLGELSLGETPVTITWDGRGTAPRLRAVKAGHRQLKVTLRRDDVGQVRLLTLEALR